MKNVAVFGSTGSIGIQTLSVCSAHREEFCVYALVFGSNYERGIKQIEEFSPHIIGVFDDTAYKEVSRAFPTARIVTGSEVWKIASISELDVVVNGVSGFNGTFPLIEALSSGKCVALANKESVVCAGSLIREAMQAGGGRILPVDSEQSAIFQCLDSHNKREVRSLILTASGGAFRDMPLNDLANVTPEMAMKHPTWNMGRKITIDSATLFNKGLEVMEASFLFETDADHIEVLIHPQSIVHSMVEYRDGSVIAQLSVPDMRLAIQYAMTYPERLESPVERLDLSSCSGLSFSKPDHTRFKSLQMAYDALREGGSLPVAYNSGNEAAVERFIRGEIGFLDIFECVEYVMNNIEKGSITNMDALLGFDSQARALAHEYRRADYSR